MGSIPFGLLLTQAFTDQDLRQIGSGNIGATNVLAHGQSRPGAGHRYAGRGQGPDGRVADPTI